MRIVRIVTGEWYRCKTVDPLEFTQLSVPQLESEVFNEGGRIVGQARKPKAIEGVFAQHNPFRACRIQFRVCAAQLAADTIHACSGLYRW